MEIMEFEPSLADRFRTLNEAWVKRYFVLEPKDAEILNDPQGQIIDKGGFIFFAVEADRAVGCIWLIPMGDGGFEVIKMAVDEASQGRGYAKALLQACVDRARKLGAPRLYLESGTKLLPALALYERTGFKHLPPERRPASPYERVSVWMERVF